MRGKTYDGLAWHYVTVSDKSASQNPCLASLDDPPYITHPTPMNVNGVTKYKSILDGKHEVMTIGGKLYKMGLFIGGDELDRSLTTSLVTVMHDKDGVIARALHLKWQDVVEYDVKQTLNLLVMDKSVVTRMYDALAKTPRDKDSYLPTIMHMFEQWFGIGITAINRIEEITGNCVLIPSIIVPDAPRYDPSLMKNVLLNPLFQPAYVWALQVAEEGKLDGIFIPAAPSVYMNGVCPDTVMVRPSTLNTKFANPSRLTYPRIDPSPAPGPITTIQPHPNPNIPTCAGMIKSFYRLLPYYSWSKQQPIEPYEEHKDHIVIGTINIHYGDGFFITKDPLQELADCVERCDIIAMNEMMTHVEAALTPIMTRKGFVGVCSMQDATVPYRLYTAIYYRKSIAKPRHGGGVTSVVSHANSVRTMTSLIFDYGGTDVTVVCTQMECAAMLMHVKKAKPLKHYWNAAAQAILRVNPDIIMGDMNMNEVGRENLFPKYVNAGPEYGTLLYHPDWKYDHVMYKNGHVGNARLLPYPHTDHIGIVFNYYADAKNGSNPIVERLLYHTYDGAI